MRGLFWLCSIGSLVLACGSSAAPAAAPQAPVAPTPKVLHLRIVSNPDTNSGSALHVLVRKTTKTDYPRQEYEDVAASLLLESDPDTLDWLVVRPDRTQDVWVARPEDAEIAVYFLFSDPRGSWKHLVADASVQRVLFHVARDHVREARWTDHVAEPKP